MSNFSAMMIKNVRWRNLCSLEHTLYSFHVASDSSYVVFTCYLTDTHKTCIFPNPSHNLTLQAVHSSPCTWGRLVWRSATFYTEGSSRRLHLGLFLFLCVCVFVVRSLSVVFCHVYLNLAIFLLNKINSSGKILTKTQKKQLGFTATSSNFPSLLNTHYFPNAPLT